MSIKRENNLEVVRRYNAVDGIRAYAAVAIVMMHIYENSSYNMPLAEMSRIFTFLNNLTFLFMIVSSFTMCCGYYDSLSNNQISMSSFYEKRYLKVWPYFALLVVLDFMMSPSVDRLIEVFADLTLCFGLLPNANISVIGVGWFLGVVFIFYMLFPFFCFLLKNSRRAVGSFVIAVLLNLSCQHYFFDTYHVVAGFYARTSFAFCAMFFMAGGIIFLFKDRISNYVEKFRWFVMILSILLTVLYFFRPEKMQTGEVMHIWLLFLYSLWLCYAIGTEGKMLNNKGTKFLSEISMEIYLSHMGIFRLLERLKFTTIMGNSWSSYILTVSLTLTGAIIFSLCARQFLRNINSLVIRLQKN